MSNPATAQWRDNPSVIVAGARTPIGKLSSAFASLTSTDLGAVAVKGALAAAKVDPASVDYVILGQVLTAGTGQGPARQTAVAAGIPWSVPAIAINKLCLSGINAIALADSLIRAGDAEIVVAGGQESMTAAPHLLPKSRAGFKYGSVTMLDHTAHDGLSDAFTAAPMGVLTETINTAGTAGTFSRSEQDEFAARSHRRAAAAQAAGRFDEEIVPVAVPQRKGDPILVTADEGVRGDTTAETLGKLRPAFAKDGTITAGNSSQISDGAAAVVVMSKRRAEELGLEYLAEIGPHGQVAGPDSSLQLQPANALRAAAAKIGLDAGALDLYEINEAFAAVGLASARSLGLDAVAADAKINVNGGAIALGHPIGASGARIALSLALELRRRGGGVGGASLCGGGGQGDALLLRV